MISFTYRVKDQRPQLSQPESMTDLSLPEKRAEALGEANRLIDSFEKVSQSLVNMNDKPGVDQNDSPSVVAVAEQGEFSVALLHSENRTLEFSIAPDSAEEVGLHYASANESGLELYPVEGGRRLLNFNEDSSLLTYTIFD